MNQKTFTSRFFKQSPEESQEKISGLEDTIRQLEIRLDEQEILEEELSVVSKDYVLNSSSGTQETFGVVGEEIDLSMLQKFYTSEGWVYIAVWAIARTLATLPLKLEKRKVIKEDLTNTDGEVVDSVYRESWIEANAEPEYNILAYPNDSQLPVEFWMLLVIDLLCTGNAYILVDRADDAVNVDRPDPLAAVLQRTRRTKVKGIYRLNSALMEPKFSEQSLTLHSYVMQTADGVFEFSKNEIIHIRLPNPADPAMGLSPLVPVLKNILIDRFSSEHMIRFYKQGARLGGVIKTSKKLTKEQVSRLTRSFESNFTGKRNHHKTLILPEGMEYETIEVNPGETSLIEFSKFNKEPILSAFGVPPIKVGLLDGATYSNAVVQDKSFWENAALPIKGIIECGINNSPLLLRTERQLRFSFDISGIEVLQESMKDRAETAQRMMQAGWSINEIRQEIWKKGPVDDGDLVPAIAKLQGAEGPFQFTAPVPGDDDNKALPDGRQPDLVGMTDIEQTTVTFEARVAELTAINLQAGIPLGQAIAAALNQAEMEGFRDENPAETESNAENEPKSETSEDENPAKVERSPNETFDECVQRAIPKLIDEGMSQDQAVAAAHSMCELPKSSEEDTEGKTEAPDAKEVKMQNYCKILTGYGVTAIMEQKYEDVKGIFDRMESKLMEEIQDIDFASPQVQEAFKSLTKENDDEDLPLFKWIKEFVDEEAAKLGESEPDIKALKHGFENTIVGTSASFSNEDAQKFLEERGAEMVTQITETTRAQMKRVIADAYAKQDDPGEIAMKIQEAFSFIREGRAKTITRTETLTAVSKGQEMKIDRASELIPDLRSKLKKRWITAQDSRVRDGSGKNGTDADHASLDGQVVKEDEAFDNGLKFPREPGSPAQEAINCRCAVVYFVEDDEAEIDQILPEGSVLADIADTIF